MERINLLVFYTVLIFCTFPISVLSSQFFKGTTVNYPRLEDFVGPSSKSCFQDLDEVRKQGRRSQRTQDALKERKFNFVTYNNITTKDGYLLTVFRITGYENEQPKLKKPVVLIGHPMMLTSDVWFYVPGNKSIVNKLVNAGNEVWLFNSRGSRYSQGHLTLNAYTDFAYWDFSMHEIGIYDLPAVITLMLQKTNNQKIFYIGYSLSTYFDAVARAEIPELNDKFHASFWLASIIHLGHLPSYLRYKSYIDGFGVRSELMKEALRMILNGQEVGLGTDDNRRLLEYKLCTLTPFTCSLCGHMVSFMNGYDGKQIKFTDLAHMLLIANAVSFKTTMHLGQNMRYCRFQKYDYGPQKNYKFYGQLYPPLYNLSNVRSPVYMYYAERDNIATPSDQRITRDALPLGTVKGFYRVNWKAFNHFGFSYANDVDSLVYDSIVNIINSYTRVT